MKGTSAELHEALEAAPKALAQWKSLTPIARRDFLSWIDSAKQEKTRLLRIQKACSMLSAGKRRPCCYALVPMELYRALGVLPKAKAQWSELTPDLRRDFLDWIDATKQPETRRRRIQQTLEMLMAGKRSPQ
jgi:uncharacterized protein YdeI (YjbR/CyaY-like superfamily)